MVVSMPRGCELHILELLQQRVAMDEEILRCTGHLAHASLHPAHWFKQVN